MVIVDSHTYDDNVVAEGLQAQIDEYYKPRAADRIRRVTVVLEALDPKEGEKILDVGCGVGTFAYHAATKGAVTTGIDYSEKSIQAARTLCEQFGVGQKTTFVIGNALQLPFPDNTFDKVVSADFIEHIYDHEKVTLMKEIIRVSKPGASIVIFTPNKIREDLGSLFWKARHAMFGDKIPTTDLHYGLITRSGFENILNERHLSYLHIYADPIRPFLANIPLIRGALALNLLWRIKVQK